MRIGSYMTSNEIYSRRLDLIIRKGKEKGGKGKGMHRGPGKHFRYSHHLHSVL